MATDIKKLADELVNMTILEVNELKNLLKDAYGIEPAAAAVAVAAAAHAGADRHFQSPRTRIQSLATVGSRGRIAG